MLLLPNPSDGDLLRRMQSGDESAFTELYRRYQGPIFRFAVQMSGRAEMAEEVTQEVFMHLMRGVGNYREEKGPLLAYLYGVARNQVLRHLERDRMFVGSLDDPESDVDPPVAANDVFAELALVERVELLRQSVLSLPGPYREVVVLCVLHELDYAEAAIVLGCPIGTVRSRLHRARTLLLWKMRAMEECPA